jgi:uncharacterized protein (TIGR04552 family)
MRPDAIELDESPPVVAASPVLGALDRDAVQLALSGGSVVDWTGLSFRSYDEVNQFLALMLCDVVRHPWANERLTYLYNQAVNYLEEHIGLTFPAEVRRPRDVRDAFLRASMRDRFSRHRIQYCAILKLMHVVNHLEMQELRGQCAVRELDVIDLANEKVVGQAHRMLDEGLPVRAFYGNRKTRPSVITKLLAKRESTAATIYDKLRFRIVTETRADIVPAMAWLFRNLVPFCAVIPGESHNNLLSEEEVADALRQAPDLRGALRPAASALPMGASGPSGSANQPESKNTHSASSYRVVNFIADLPVRIYDIPTLWPPRHRALLGEAVAVLVEFQMVDVETERANESGENRHDLYKSRQMARVWERLGRSPRR